jgi:alkylated DNA repair dioxygenase AlkB
MARRLVSRAIDLESHSLVTMTGDMRLEYHLISLAQWLDCSKAKMREDSLDLHRCQWAMMMEDRTLVNR